MPFGLRDIWSITSKVVYNLGKRVGIGTTDPQHSLDVVGDINADSLYEGHQKLEDKYVETIGREKFTDVIISDIPQDQLLQGEDIERFESNLAIRFRFDKEDFLKNSASQHEDKHVNIKDLYSINLLSNSISQNPYGNYYIIGDASAYFDGLTIYYVMDNYVNQLQTRWDVITDITFTMWLRLNKTSDGTILHSKSYSDTSLSSLDNVFFKIYIENSKVCIDWKARNQDIISCKSLNNMLKINEWFHICLIVESIPDNKRRFKLFVNGLDELLSENEVSYLNFSDVKYNIIGSCYDNLIDNQDFYKNSDDFSSNLSGYIDDFRIYDRAFTFHDIKDNLTGSILSLKSDGISTFGNKGVFLKPYEEKIGIHTKNPESNLHIVGNTLITDGYLHADTSRLQVIHNSNIISSNIDVDVINSSLTITNNIHVISNLTVDGVTHLDSNIVNKITVTEECQIDCNIVKNEYVESNLVVDGIATMNSNIVSNIDVLNVLNSMCNITHNVHVLNNLNVDGVTYLDSNIVNKITVIGECQIDCNIVKNEYVESNLIVDGIATINSNIVSNIDVLNVLNSMCNITHNVHVLHNLTVDGVTHLDSNVVNKITVTEEFRTTCNVVTNEHIDNLLLVDGIARINCNIVSNLYVIDVMESECNIVTDSYIRSNLVVDGVLDSYCNIVRLLNANDKITTYDIDANNKLYAKHVICDKLELTNDDGSFQVKSSNKFDKVYGTEFVEIDIKKVINESDLLNPNYNMFDELRDDRVFFEFFDGQSIYFEIIGTQSADSSIVSSDTFIMYRHIDGVYRYNQNYKQSIGLNDVSFNTRSSVDQELINLTNFSILLWLKPSVVKDEGEYFSFGNITIGILRNDLNIYINNDLTQIKNFFIAGNPYLGYWNNIIILYNNNDTRMYIYWNYRLIYSSITTFVLSFQKKFPSNNDYTNDKISLNNFFTLSEREDTNINFNIYDAFFLWNEFKSANEIKLAFEQPLFIMNDGLGHVNSYTYDDVGGRINTITSIYNTLEVKRSYVNIKQPLHVLTNGTIEPIGDLVVNDVYNSLKNVLMKRRNTAIISNYLTYDDDEQCLLVLSLNPIDTNIVGVASSRVDFMLSKWSNVDRGSFTKMGIDMTHEDNEDVNRVITMMSDGRVGINIDNPSCNLHVVGDSKIDGNLTIRDSTLINDIEILGTAKLNELEMNNLTLSNLTVLNSFTTADYSFNTDIEIPKTLTILSEDGASITKEMEPYTNMKFIVNGPSVLNGDCKINNISIEGNDVKNVGDITVSDINITNKIDIQQGEFAFRNGQNRVIDADSSKVRIYHNLIVNEVDGNDQSQLKVGGMVTCRTINITPYSEENNYDNRNYEADEAQIRFDNRSDSEQIIMKPVFSSSLQCVAIGNSKIVTENMLDRNFFDWDNSENKVSLITGDFTTLSQAIKTKTTDIGDTKIVDKIIMKKPTEFSQRDFDIDTIGDNQISFVKNNQAYIGHIWTDPQSIENSITFNTSDSSETCSVLIVGGGGAGGYGGHGGGGGGGDVIYIQDIKMRGKYTIKVGAGGDAISGSEYSVDNRKGEDSSISKIGNAIIARGGEPGGQTNMIKVIEGTETNTDTIVYRNINNKNKLIDSNSHGSGGGAGGAVYNSLDDLDQPQITQKLIGGRVSQYKNAVAVKALMVEPLHYGVTNTNIVVQYGHNDGGNSFYMVDSSEDEANIYITSGGGGSRVSHSDDGISRIDDFEIDAMPGIAVNQYADIDSNVFRTGISTDDLSLIDYAKENRNFGNGGNGLGVSIIGDTPLFFGGGGGGSGKFPTASDRIIIKGGNGGGGYGGINVSYGDSAFNTTPEQEATIAHKGFDFIENNHDIPEDELDNKIAEKLNGINNTGGGGGGGIQFKTTTAQLTAGKTGELAYLSGTFKGGNGGSGIVIITYKLNNLNVKIYGNLDVFGTVTATNMSNTQTSGGGVSSGGGGISVTSEDLPMSKWYATLFILKSSSTINISIGGQYSIDSIDTNTATNDDIKYFFTDQIYYNNDFEIISTTVFDSFDLEPFNADKFMFDNNGNQGNRYDPNYVDRASIIQLKTMFRINTDTTTDITIPTLESLNATTFILNPCLVYVYIDSVYITHHKYDFRDNGDGGQEIVDDSSNTIPNVSLTRGMHKMEIYIYEVLSKNS